jgi:hypothetical protein
LEPIRTDGEPVQVVLELSMRDGTFGLLFESDSEWAAEADRRHGDVAGNHAFPDRAIAPSCFCQALEDLLCRCASIRPVHHLDHRMDDVDHAQAGVNGIMQVAT